MSASSFGKATMRDPQLVFNLRKGRELRKASGDKILRFIKDNSDFSPLLGTRETPREFEHAATSSLTVEINNQDLKDAAKLGLNAGDIARRAVEVEVKAARLKAWVSENQSAFDAHAKDVEENGLWSDGLRQF